MKILPVGGNYYSNLYKTDKVNRLNTDVDSKSNAGLITFGQLARKYNKIMHIVLDGVGINENSIKGNPLIGNMPFLSSLKNGQGCMTLYRKIEAAGEFVGSDKGEPGNSEVGHGVMGAGRNIKQAMVRLDEAIEDGSFFKNREFLRAMNWAKEHNSTLHILGSIGYSHTHSKMEHIQKLIEMARANGVEKLAVHAFVNGDGPTASSSKEYVNMLNNILDANGYPQISSLIGRGIALDKSGDASKIEKGFRMLTDGKDVLQVESIREGLDEQLKHNAGVKLEPVIVKDSPRISDNDAVIFANYRTDRPKAITAALAYKDSNYEFLKSAKRPQNLYFVCMTEYDPKFNLPHALDNMRYDGTLKEILLDKGWHITSCAQKEKHSHVTYFYNGSKDIRHPNLKDIKLSGCTAPDLLPASLAEQVKVLIHEMDYNPFEKHFIVANLANGDIIGHMGNPYLSVSAARDLDKSVEELVNSAIENDYAVVITADHGNIENGFSTKHTENPVPCFVVLPKHEEEIANKVVTLRDDAQAALRDVAPTILDIAGLDNGEKMTGKSLLIEA